MKRRFPAIVICLLLICSVFIPISLGGYVKNIPYQPVSSNRGNWLYVGGSGGDNYTKIQDAVDNASDGDTVFVYDDSSPYYESITIKNSINLFGEDKNTTIIKETLELSRDGIAIKADYVNVSGFTIQNFTYSIDAGVQIYNKSYCNIIDNIFKSNCWGIRIDKSHYNNLSKNIMFKQQTDGIYLEHGSNYNTIIDNTIYNNYHSGLSIVGKNNLIYQNNINRNSYGAIDIFGDNNRIIGNIIDNNYGDIYVHGEQNDFTNNVFSNNEIGIYIDIGEYNNISNNVFSYNQYYGILIRQYQVNPKNNIVFNNTFIENGDNFIKSENVIIGNSFFNDGIKIESDCVVKNNYVNDKPLVYLVEESDLVIENESGMIILHKCKRMTIKNQDISNTINGIYLINSNDCLIHNNSISSNKKNGILLEE